MKKLICLIVALILSEFTFETLAGSNVQIADGDSFEMGNKRIRLIGIDAPEYFQECLDAKEKSYPCGIHAKNYLKKMIEEGERHGQKLKCKSEGIDRYNRDLSVCYIGKTNINFEMVKSGWAVSYKHNRYQYAEKRAKESKRGVWQGKFMRPEFYRAVKRSQKNQ